MKAMAFSMERGPTSQDTISRVSASIAERLSDAALLAVADQVRD
jgi:hypothetical protein